MAIDAIYNECYYEVCYRINLSMLSIEAVYLRERL